PLWAVALIMNNAVLNELVDRYGMMTICAGVTRGTARANLMQAVFFTFAVGLKNLQFYGVEITWTPLLIAGCASQLCRHMLQGLAYARFGLLAAIALHVVIDLQILLHALL